MRLVYTCQREGASLNKTLDAGYRRRWGAFRAYYLVMKLSVLVVVALVSKDNCIFSRTNVSRAMLEVVQQGVLLFFLSIWLAVQIALKPFHDSNGNISEIVSRSSVVLSIIIRTPSSADAMACDSIARTYL